MSSLPPGPSIAPPAIVAAIGRLLRPLVRLMLGHGMTYPQLLELLKGAFVEVADTHFRLPKKGQTDSRISLLTGIHRKDVRRLRATRGEESSTPRSVTLGAQLVARWAGTPGLQDADGQPMALPRTAGRAGGAQSFEALVAAVSKDIRPRVVLDEWLRLGIAELDTEDRVVLRTGAFVPHQGSDERAWYLGRNVHDHLAAAVHNLQGGQPPLLERSVYYDRLSPGAIAELAALTRDAAMEALQRVNAAALALQERDAGDPQARQRMSFGAYYYDTVSDPTRSETDPGSDHAPG